MFCFRCKLKLCFDTNCIVVGFIYLNTLFNMIGGYDPGHVTPPRRGGVLEGCDRVVSEPLVIVNLVLKREKAF